jgi:putative transposase
LELIICYGVKGLLAALPLFYPLISLQRCWAHKARNIYAKVRKADWPALKADLHAVCYALTLEGARRAIRGFRGRWWEASPAAVRCLEADEDRLLAFLAAHDEESRKLVRTTNAIERLFREVSRRTNPMGAFYDHTILQRMMFAVFIYHNQKQGSGAPFSLVTQNY